MDITFGLRIGPEHEDWFVKLGGVFPLKWGPLRCGMEVMLCKCHFNFSYHGPKS